MATEPLAGRRMTKVTARRTKTDWAHFLNDIAERHPGAKRITLVMDNLNTHRPGALYEAFPPAEAKALWDRFEFVYTPKHGSWLNVAEVEQDGARSNRPATPHRDRAAPLGLDHATPVEMPERTAACIGCVMRRDQAAVGGIRTNLAVIGLRICSVGAILFRSRGTPVAGSTRTARGPRVRIAIS